MSAVGIKKKIIWESHKSSKSCDEEAKSFFYFATKAEFNAFNLFLSPNVIESIKIIAF